MLINSPSSCAQVTTSRSLIDMSSALGLFGQLHPPLYSECILHNCPQTVGFVLSFNLLTMPTLFKPCRERCGCHSILLSAFDSAAAWRRSEKILPCLPFPLILRLAVSSAPQAQLSLQASLISNDKCNHAHTDFGKPLGVSV